MGSVSFSINRERDDMKVICLGANNPETIRLFRCLADTHELVGFIDNDATKWGKDFYGYPVFGGMSEVGSLAGKGYVFVNLITRDCTTRHGTTCDILERGGSLTNIIHPSVSTDMVEMKTGNYIQEAVILQAGVTIGSNVSVHMGSLIGHESQIGDSVFVAHGVNLCGLVSLSSGVFVGAGATILPRLSVGEWSIVGAGALVTKNVKPYTVVAGNPAKPVRSVTKADLVMHSRLLQVSDSG